jgi:hypothetical protein
MHGEVLMEVQEDSQPGHRRLVGIDLGIVSRHSVRVLESDGRAVCRASCVPAVESLSAVERAALAGAPAGTRLAVVFEPTGPAWMPIADPRGLQQLELPGPDAAAPGPAGARV